MPINKESLNRRLARALGRYDPKPVNDQNEVVPLEDEADAFKFNFTKDGENYGLVYVTLDDTNTLTIWYDNEIMDSPSEPTKGMDYDDTWTGFLKFIKRWAMNNQLSFKLENKDRLGPEMARRKRMKEKEKISEGYHAMGKKASYNDAVPNVKIILQHSKVMQEGEQRFRHIEKIFVENQQGERFLLPTNKPGLARVFARHIAEGGTPYDERAGHLQSLVEEYNKMAGFVRATRNNQFNESAQKLVQEGVNHYLKLRESLGKLTGHRGYTAYFESWTPPLMEDEADTNTLNELFVQETLDPRIESVMPILSRLHKQVSEMSEVKSLDEWADKIISEKMVMGADTDASSGGTVFSYAEDQVEESGLQAYLGNKKYGKEGMDALRKAGREHAGKEKMAKIRAKYDKLDEEDISVPEDLDENDLNSPKKSDIPATFRKDTGKPDWQVSKKDLEKEKERNISSPEGLKALSQKLGKLEEDPVEEGLRDIANTAVKKLKQIGSKALSTLGHPSDDEMLRQFKKNIGQRGHEHSKPSMAYSQVDKRDPDSGEVLEDLGPEQKRVGQLGPTEKVGPKGAVGKLVGASESIELGEMDSQGYTGTRDDGNPWAKGNKATPVKAKEFAKQALKTLNKISKAHSKNKTDENFINMVPQAVAEEDGHTEEENGMASDNLNKMAKASQKIGQKVKGMGNKNSLEPWQQQLVATAADKVDAVYHSMDDEGNKSIKEGQDDLAAIKRLLGK
jgi:hypothetical protein